MSYCYYEFNGLLFPNSLMLDIHYIICPRFLVDNLSSFFNVDINARCILQGTHLSDLKTQFPYSFIQMPSWISFLMRRYQVLPMSSHSWCNNVSFWPTTETIIIQDWVAIWHINLKNVPPHFAGKFNPV